MLKKKKTAKNGRNGLDDDNFQFPEKHAKYNAARRFVVIFDT